MLLPGPQCLMGPEPPPIAAVSIAPHSAMCHFQVSSHCWCVTFFVIGCWQITGPPISCCQAPNLPWALYRLLMLLPGPECVMGPCTASLLLSPSPHSAMCHFQVSSHCWWFPF
ncbi:unnamed protein product, partial [Staurois parvus]